MEVLSISVNGKVLNFELPPETVAQLVDDDELLKAYVKKAAKASYLKKNGITSKDADRGLDVKKLRLMPQMPPNTNENQIVTLKKMQNDKILKRIERDKQRDAAPVDVIQKCIGVFGRWHFGVCFLVFLCKFPIAWHQLSIVFIAPPIEFQCADSTIKKCSPNCKSYKYNTSLFTETIVTQWDLVCGKANLASLAQTITMLGILVGNMVFGYLSDICGRKNPLLWEVMLQAVTGVAAAFSPWYWLFMIMRFLAAFATGGSMVTSFVLIMELVGTRLRTIVGILYQIPFNLGHLTLPLIGYMFRDWRWVQTAISLPSVFLVIYYWLVPESPRWLLIVGKKEKAIETLKRAAKHNRLPTDNIEQDIDTYLQNQPHIVGKQKKGNIVDLVRTPIMRIYTIAICYNWVVCGFCFFGVAQFIGQIGGDIFINVALSAVIQIPSTLFACWSTKAWGRKITLIVADMVAGIGCLVIAATPADPTWIHSVFSTISMFGLALAFPTVYIYSGELFPTAVRNVGVGTSSMSARIGSMIAPFVVTLNTVQVWLPPLIFGIIPLIGAALCLLLPETLDCQLPNTIEEAEQFHKLKKKDAREAGPS